MSSTTSLLGEFECRIDDKNRIILPSKLKKQLPPEADGKFTIIKGPDTCLEMYPQNEWDLIVEKINKKNFFKKENRRFVRLYYRGMTITELDSQNRIVLPKEHFPYAGIDKEVILFAYKNRIEIWDKDTFNQDYSEKGDDFADLVEKVLGDEENEPVKKTDNVS